MASSGFNLGAYFGYPGDAAFGTRLNAFIALTGQSPSFIDVGVDYTKAMSTWTTSAQGSATRLAAAMGTSVTPVLQVPLASTLADGLTSAQRFAAIANGSYDDVWLGMINAFKAQGFSTIDLRIGWEMNGNWYPWKVQTAADAQGYISAFQHITTLARSVSGITVNTVWNPAEINNETLQTQASYPGDDYVDIVALDTYSTLYPLSLYDWTTHTVDATAQQWYADAANMQHYWDYPDANQYFPTGKGTGFGLLEAIDFAKAHGKAFGLAETGAGDSGGATGPVDNAAFPEYLADRLLAAAASGVKIAFANIWDATSFVFTDGTRPNEAAAWADFVQRMSAGLSATTSATVASYGTLSKGAGNYAVTGASASITRGTVTLGDGTSSVTLTGWADVVTIGNGNETVSLTGSNMVVTLGNGAETVSLTGSYGSVTIGNTPAGSTSTIQLSGSTNTVKAGTGTVVVNGAATTGGTTVTLGNGADTVTLSGSNNVVTVGTGASTITVGNSTAYGSKITTGGALATGGTVNVTIVGKSNTVDLGAGTNVVTSTAGGTGDRFIVNGSGQGLTTISGFAIGGDSLDLTRTLASTGIGTDLTKIATYVKASAANGGADTLLSVDPTGSGAAGYGFVLLKGVVASNTMMSDMLAKNDFVLH